MAKVNGPFMSLDASGTIAGVLTASKWKGRNYMRIKTNPANPKTPAQLAVRSILGTLSKIAVAVLRPAEDTNGIGSAFFLKARELAPSGQSWISWLQKALNSKFSTLISGYNGIESSVKAFYEEEAGDIGLTQYIDVNEVTHKAGEQLFVLAFFAVNYLGYTGFSTGIETATALEVEALAEYVNKSAN